MDRKNSFWIEISALHRWNRLLVLKMRNCGTFQSTFTLSACSNSSVSNELFSANFGSQTIRLTNQLRQTNQRVLLTNPWIIIFVHFVFVFVFIFRFILSYVLFGNCVPSPINISDGFSCKLHKNIQLNKFIGWNQNEWTHIRRQP